MLIAPNCFTVCSPFHGLNQATILTQNYKNVKKQIERGVAIPTCLSVNNTICHCSPLASDETTLEEGDILKM